MNLDIKKTRWYWSPSAHFRPEGEGVRIAGFVYGRETAAMFPGLYYLTQDGCTLEEMLEAFENVPEERLAETVREFSRRGFLIRGPEEIDKVFYPQSACFDSPEGWILLDAERTAALKKRALERCACAPEQADSTVYLKRTKLDSIAEERSSIRSFSDRQLRFEEVSAFLQIAGRRIREGASGRYYPSAGGLAPVDLYLYAGDDRVEDVENGLYYYEPQRHCLHRLQSGSCITSASQFPLNREIFETAALNLYFFYDCSMNMPRYGSRGYFYGIVDSGILAAFLTMQAQKLGLGSCIIGDQEFDGIRDLFGLRSGQIFLFGMSVGAV